MNENVFVPRESYQGCIPNETERRNCKAVGIKSSIERLTEIAIPWDATDTPSVVDCATYYDTLIAEANTCRALRNAGQLKPWWERAKNCGLNIDNLLVPSQGAKGSCAGFSMFQNAYITTLIKQIGRGSEQSIEEVNAMVTYAMSLGCSRDGQYIPSGQSIAAVLEYGCKVGTFPAALVGSYDPSARFRSDWLVHEAEAAKRQMCVCPLVDKNGNDIDDMAEIIATALVADKVVEVGNSTAVRGSETDSNGVSIARLGGSWAHATIFDEYQSVNGKDYFHWTNSHGNIYNNADNSPKTGCWFTKEQLESFVRGSWTNAGIIVYAESPHGKDNTILYLSEVIE